MPFGSVYPRVCGGTGFALLARMAGMGLSPRVRGNPLSYQDWQIQRGSIPACAGEPMTTSPGAGASGVYPRVCGGTVSKARTASANDGLSPRVRGNPRQRTAAIRRLRSIPACAGEPRRPRLPAIQAGVYPRVCGGTVNDFAIARKVVGLSPRVRGNHALAYVANGNARSIPACAGEPSLSNLAYRVGRVYPRVCGGTLDGPACAGRGGGDGSGSGVGLSPRVRGNPSTIRLSASMNSSMRRSIPACAGEPFPRAKAGYAGGVYPRVCGGTILRNPFRSEK